MTPARLRWGLILVQIGGLVLLRNTGVLNDNFWADLLLYSPVVLIAIGLEKIFTRTRLQFIAYLTSVALFFGGFALAFSGSWGGDQTSFFSETTFEKSFDPTVQKVSAILNLDNTDLTVRDCSDDLISARFDRFTRKPSISEKIEDGVFNIELTSRYGNLLGGAITIDAGDTQDWYIKFSRKVPLELDCRGNNSDIHLNLSTTPLEKLNLKADEASIYLMLGDLRPQVRVTIRGEDSDLRLRVPENTGLRVQGRGYGDLLTRLGFKESPGGFVSDGYDTLQPKYDVDLDEHLSSVSIDYF
jgi:hypothetical protein